MKKYWIYYFGLVVMLASCTSPTPKGENAPKTQKDKSLTNWGRDFQLGEGNKSAVPWQAGAQDWVKDYRNHNELQPEVPDNGQMKKVHGISIDIEDILQVLDPDGDGQYNQEVRKLYLMPALRDTVINDTARKFFTFVMAPLQGDPNQVEVNTSMEVILKDNRAYDFYSFCPPNCPTISWYGTDMPDDEAL